MLNRAGVFWERGEEGRGEWGRRGGEVPFLTALAFSALRWACAGFVDFSFAIVATMYFSPPSSVYMTPVLEFKRFYPPVEERIRCEYSQRRYVAPNFNASSRPF